MKVEFINPFIKASTEVLKMIARIDFVTGKPYMKVSPFSPSSVLIVVGITGAIKGQAVISMSNDLARSVASRMMMGMPVDELDEMSKSALSELGNMIMGNAATLLFNNNISVDITPPSLMVGEGITISSGSMTTIGIPLTSEIGTMNLDISVKEG